MPRLLDPISTVAIILGAYDWTKAGLINAPSFRRSAAQYHRYLITPPPYGLGLHPDLTLSLFDDPSPAGTQLVRIRDTIRSFVREGREAEHPITDVLIYYVGHGSVDGGGHLHLLVKDSSEGIEEQSSIAASSLAQVLRVAAPQQRRLVVLDCCFSEAAAAAFGGMGTLNEAVAATALRDLEPGVPPPERGTLLLCSSPRHRVSIGLPNAELTLFTGAMLSVLEEGSPERRSEMLSFGDLRDDIYDRMLRDYEGEAPRPALHQPDQQAGDLTHLPAFPNAALARRRAEEERQAAEARRKAEEERQAAEARRKAEEERQAAEARRHAEEERQDEAARQAEEERQAAEARRKAEEERQAAEARRKAEEERQAEAARQAARHAEDTRQAEEGLRIEEEPRTEVVARRPEPTRNHPASVMLIATVIFCVLGGAAYFATRAPPEQPRGMLALHIQPPTAVLRLDGNQVGSAADFRQEIAAGAHELEISAEGYQSRHEAVTVPAGGEKSVEFALVMVPPPPTTGILALRVSPPAAVLKLDGKPVGTAADFRQEIAAGAHELEISAEGYQSRHEAVTVPVSGEKSVELALVMVPPPPTTGILELYISPSGAALTLDDARIGSANGFRRELPAGPHKIEITAPRYLAINQTLTIKAGEVNSVRFELAIKPTPQKATGRPRPTNEPSWVPPQVQRTNPAPPAPPPSFSPPRSSPVPAAPRPALPPP